MIYKVIWYYLEVTFKKFKPLHNFEPDPRPFATNQNKSNKKENPENVTFRGFLFADWTGLEPAQYRVLFNVFRPFPGSNVSVFEHFNTFPCTLSPPYRNSFKSPLLQILSSDALETSGYDNSRHDFERYRQTFQMYLSSDHKTGIG